MTNALKKQSEVITALRFWLMLLVIFIHVPLAEDFMRPLDLTFSEGLSRAAYLYVSKVISFSLGHAAVPTFFVISGYYMFYKERPWHVPRVYGQEMLRRSTSLLLPYILWNALFVLGEVLHNAIIPTSFSLDLYGSTTSERLYMIFFGGPANFPLWYLRDLIILCLLAPLIHYVASRSALLLLLPVMILLLGIDIPVMSEASLFYFTLGAHLGCRQEDMIGRAQSTARVTLPLLGICSLLFPFSYGTASFQYYLIGYTFLAVLGFLALGGVLYDRGAAVMRWGMRLSPAVFFVYVVHEVQILSSIRGLMYSLGVLETIPGYFLTGALVMGVSLTGFYLLKAVSPRLLGLLSGGR